MRHAIDLSQEKMDANCGGPFGAIIVRNGKIIGEGWNEVTSSNDPTAHAEVQAIRKATAAIGDYKLEGCEIYTSCEPCPMCLAAIYWARIDRIFYANTREDAARIGFDDDFLYREITQPEHKRTLPSDMMLNNEARIVFENWEKKPDKTPY
ncbi:MAG: nucleoside deaminase [Alphaproteobacteria bacterium]|nr:nucleoside deaminase [Alphaproteobacteria bacterium]